MKCPFCSSIGDKVIDSRSAREHVEIRRRRECEACGRRYTTYERIEEALPQVVKRDDRREPFDREKIVAGLMHACAKRSIARDRLEALALEVEREVCDLGEKEVASGAIGERVLARLRAVDEIAYIRFASIHRSFRDIDEFRAELERLARSR